MQAQNSRFDQIHSRSSAFYKLGRVSMLEQWSVELSRLVQKWTSPPRWHIVGRAVMLVLEDQKKVIRMLQEVAKSSGMGFVELDPGVWMESVLSGEYPDTDEPTLFHIRQGQWSIQPEGYSEDQERIRQFQLKLPKYLSDIPPERVMVFATSGEAFTSLSEPLRSLGAFDRHFIVPDSSLEERGNHFLDAVGRSICGASLLEHPHKIGKVLDEEFDDPRREGLAQISLQRLAHREGRLLQFNDLAFIGSYGTSETDRFPDFSEKTMRKVASHEAGHALIAIVDSDEENIPEIVSLVANHAFKGLMTDSYVYQASLDGRFSYRDIRHMIRVLLAGRAAEELVNGPEHMGVWSARDDLVHATSRARDLVGRYGFPENLEDVGTTQFNLAVCDKEPSISQDARMDEKSSIFLSRQYAAVMEMLQMHQRFLDALTEKLLQERYLDQKEIAEIWRNYKDVAKQSNQAIAA